MLFRKIMSIYSKNQAKHIKQYATKCRFMDCRSKWHIYLPLGPKWLIQARVILFGTDCHFTSYSWTLQFSKGQNFIEQVFYVHTAVALWFICLLCIVSDLNYNYSKSYKSLRFGDWSYFRCINQGLNKSSWTQKQSGKIYLCRKPNQFLMGCQD
jgi:hypothetical protein